jgi:hypothetical protein
MEPTEPPTPTATTLGETATPGSFPDTGGNPEAGATTLSWLYALLAGAFLISSGVFALAASRVREQ